MAKYMILYSSTKSASDTMAEATPEQMKASMEEWIAWKDEASKTATFDFGMPLQGVSQITSTDVMESSSLVSGYSMIEGDQATVTELLKSHPHLKREGASIDLLEVLPMPGM